MTRVTVDADLLAKLGNLSQFLELCDDSGRVVAHVLPASDLNKIEYDPTTPAVSEDELDRRAASNESRYTTQEVLERLGKL